MIKLLLVRHGETTWNAEHRYIGRTDLPLSGEGRRQARALADRLASEPISAVYTSDLRRALETAAVIASAHGLPVRSDPRLREMDFGLWEGLSAAEVERHYAAELAAWRAGLGLAPPGGETLTAVAARVQAVLDEIAERHRLHTVAIVAHGGTLQMVLFLSLGIPPRGGWVFHMYNASLSEVRLDRDGAALIRLNDTHHLPPPR